MNAEELHVVATQLTWHSPVNIPCGQSRAHQTELCSSASATGTEQSEVDGYNSQLKVVTVKLLHV